MTKAAPGATASAPDQVPETTMAVVSPRPVAASQPSMSLQPTTLAELVEFSARTAKSELVPTAYQGKPDDIIVAATMGQAVGFTVMQSLSAIAVINGKASLYGDALMAVARRHPDCLSIDEAMAKDGDGNIIATCTVRRRTITGEVETICRRFDIKAAKRARLWNKRGPWTDYPSRMLQMRARSWAVRDAFADALAGFYGAEEARDGVAPGVGAAPGIAEVAPTATVGTTTAADALAAAVGLKSASDNGGNAPETPLKPLKEEKAAATHPLKPPTGTP